MKLTIVKQLTFLFGLILTSISFGQSSIDINTNRDNLIISNEINPNMDPDSLTGITNATTSNWHSKNSIDGTVTISKRRNESQIVHNQEYLKNEIVRINDHIEMINAKIESIKSDKKLKKKANKSGWFDAMERIKSELKNQKLEIQNTLIKIELK